MILPFSIFRGRTFSFFGLGGGLGPRLGVKGGFGFENPRVPDELTAATLKRYHLPGFSTSRSEILVLEDEIKRISCCCYFQIVSTYRLLKGGILHWACTYLTIYLFYSRKSIVMWIIYV